MKTSEERSPLNRSLRKELKYRGCFLCEWCRRWTVVPMNKYWEILGIRDLKATTPEAIADKKADVKFQCHRPACLAMRS